MGKIDIFIEEDYIVFRDEKYFEYDIMLSNVNTPEKIMDMVADLCEKNWFTPELVTKFVVTTKRLYCEANKL